MLKTVPPFAEASLKLRKQLRLERDGYSKVIPIKCGINYSTYGRFETSD
jgi:hypothetical protein